MKVKRIVKFNIKKSHIDYKYIKTQLIESKEIYNFANYILRQLYFKNSNKHKYSLNFIEEYPTLKELFLEYIDENKQFTSLFYKIICEFSKLRQYSINLKIVQNIVDKLKNDWTSYWKLLKMKKDKTYDKKINIPRYKKKYNLVEYNNQVISKKKLKLGYIGTDKMEQGIKIANRHKDLDCKCFRIYNKNDKILCELIYEKIVRAIEQFNTKYTGIHLNVYPIRIDRTVESSTYSIQDRILEAIKSCSLIIADLSSKNINVYHEIGYAMGVAQANNLLPNMILLYKEDTQYKDKNEDTDKFIGFNLRNLSQLRFKDYKQLVDGLIERLEKHYEV